MSMSILVVEDEESIRKFLSQWVFEYYFSKYNTIYKLNKVIVFDLE